MCHHVLLDNFAFLVLQKGLAGKLVCNQYIGIAPLESSLDGVDFCLAAGNHDAEFLVPQLAEGDAHGAVIQIPVADASFHIKEP